MVSLIVGARGYLAPELGDEWSCVRSIGTLLSSLGRVLLRFCLWRPPHLLFCAEEPVTPAAIAADPMTTASVVIDTESAKQPASFAELRLQLDSSDRDLALNALQVALTELSDGATLVWRRPSRELTGRDQARLGVSRRRGQGVPSPHLFAFARHLCAAGRGHRLPRARRQVVACGLILSELPIPFSRSPLAGEHARASVERRGRGSVISTPSLTLPLEGGIITLTQQPPSDLYFRPRRWGEGHGIRASESDVSSFRSARDGGVGIVFRWRGF